MDYDVKASVFNVTISAGTTSSSFNIDIIDDVTHEDNETFNVAIRLLPSCLSLSLGISSSTVMIIDDDGRYIHTYNINTHMHSQKHTYVINNYNMGKRDLLIYNAYIIPKPKGCRFEGVGICVYIRQILTTHVIFLITNTYVRTYTK